MPRARGHQVKKGNRYKSREELGFNSSLTLYDEVLARNGISNLTPQNNGCVATGGKREGAHFFSRPLAFRLHT